MGALDIFRGDKSVRSLTDSFSQDFGRMLDEMERFMRSFRIQGDDDMKNLTCDVDETDNEFIITADLPGVKKDDVAIEVSGRNLIIHAERHREEEEETRHRHFSTRYFGSFDRSIYLPDNVDKDEIYASFNNGVLEICMPKMESEQTNRIEISEGETETRKLSGESKQQEKEAKKQKAG